VPKVVDHQERRAELARAVWQLAAREGVEALTVRRVAAEAGWSTGALVHYFRDKEELILFAFETTVDRVGRRLRAAAERTDDPLELARALLVEGLPLDAERRAEVRVWFAVLGLALTRPALARAERVAYRAWRGRLAATLREAQERGLLDPELDCEREAAALIALVDGLAVQATFEPRALPSERLLELVDERLARLRPKSPPPPGPHSPTPAPDSSAATSDSTPAAR
jgi:AcrR family transcriptional regulator